jgi:phthalate 4,5-dioxygenase
VLNAADNELLTRVGADTPMGQWLRRFWTPLMLAEDLPEPDGAPLERRMYGEDLLVFRDTEGRVGVIQPLCPHRQAPLVYGRNEENGLRCIYHGWKFDVNGTCVDMPNEPADSDFKHKVRPITYPTREVAGVIWVYMGPKHLQPEMPDMEWMRVEPSHRNVAKFNLEGNWVQAMEGDVDSSHVPFLHSQLGHDSQQTYKSRFFVEQKDGYYVSKDRAPRWIIQPNDVGMMIAARRNADPDTYYWRINQVYFPFYTLVAGSIEQSMFLAHFWVPTDDHHTDIWTAYWCPSPLNDEERAMMFSGPNAHIGTYNPKTGGLFANRENHFFQDRELQKTQSFSGVRGIREQDGCVTLGMGPIVDRTKEHLGTADMAVIALRRILLREARKMQSGEEPFGPSHGVAYRNRAWSGLLPRNDNFLSDPEALKMMETMVP